MAVIPDRNVLGARPIPAIRKPIVEDRSGAIIAEGISQLGEHLEKTAKIREAKEDEFKYQKARTSFVLSHSRASSELEDIEDYTTWEKEYEDRMLKAKEEAANEIRSDHDRSLFELQAQIDIDQGKERIRLKAAKHEVDDGKASLAVGLRQLHNASLEAEDSESRQQYINVAKELIYSAEKNGYITAEEAGNKDQDWSVDVAEGFLKMMSPDERMKAAANPKGTIAEALPVERLSDIMESTERQRIAEREYEYKIAQRFEKDIEDASSKEGDQLLADDQLTASWIEDNRDRLSPADFRYFYKQLSGGTAGPRNVLLYSDLRERASIGEDIRGDARNALTGGSIRVSDYNTLMNEVESSRPNWYKRGTSYIATSAAVSDINPDPAAAQKKADMLDDWSDWSQRNPDATDAQAQDAYRRIVREYSLIDKDKLLITKRQPQFLVGGYSQPDIQATKQRTRDAYENGDIDDDELDRQIVLISEWEELLRKSSGNE